MAYVNFKNSPSEETPLTGGATGNLNVMQENGTSHGTDTKLGYAQSFLNEHIITVSNEVDEDYRVNFLKGKNVFNMGLFTFRQKGSSPYYQSFYLESFSSNQIDVRCGGGSYVEAYIDVKNLKPNTKYVISWTITRNDTSFTPTLNLASSGTTDANGNLTINVNLNNGGTSSNNTHHVIFSNIQLEKGSSVTTYEPYITPSINVDGEEIYSKEEWKDITSQITMTSGFTLSNYSRLYKKGKHIIGDLVISGTINADTQYQVATLPYSPKNNLDINSFCGFSVNEFRINYIGYMYISASAKQLFVRCFNASSYAKVHIDYITD